MTLNGELANVVEATVFTLTVTASDGFVGTADATKTFLLTISGTDDVPTSTTNTISFTVEEDVAISDKSADLNTLFADPEGKPLSFTFSGAEATAGTSAQQGDDQIAVAMGVTATIGDDGSIELSGTPDSLLDTEMVTFTVSAHDGTSSSSSAYEITVTITADDDKVALSGAKAIRLSTAVGDLDRLLPKPIDLKTYFKDEDLTTLTYSFGEDGTAKMSTATGFSFTITDADMLTLTLVTQTTGADTLLVTATDGNDDSAVLTVSFTVLGGDALRVNKDEGNPSIPSFTQGTAVNSIGFPVAAFPDVLFSGAPGATTKYTVASVTLTDQGLAEAADGSTGELILQGITFSIYDGETPDNSGNDRLGWLGTPTPPASDKGANTLMFALVATKGAETAARFFTITVTARDDAPTLTDETLSFSVAEQAEIAESSQSGELTPLFADPEGDALSFALTGPATARGITATIKGDSIELSGTPDNLEGDTLVTFSVVANDGTSNSAAKTIITTITATNEPAIAQDKSFYFKEKATVSKTLAGANFFQGRRHHQFERDYFS